MLHSGAMQCSLSIQKGGADDRLALEGLYMLSWNQLILAAAKFFTAVHWLSNADGVAPRRATCMHAEALAGLASSVTSALEEI